MRALRATQSAEVPVEFPGPAELLGGLELPPPDEAWPLPGLEIRGKAAWVRVVLEVEEEGRQRQI